MNRETKTKLILPFVILATVVIIIMIQPWACRQIRWAAMSQLERIEDTSTVVEPLVVDSIKVLGGVITKDAFETDYHAATWFSEYHQNKVRFDKQYNKKLIDIYGEIKNISDDYGCAEIILATGNSFCEISATNCTYGTDKWSKEVENVNVGNTIHVRGYYSAAVSSNYTLSLYNCHIIED